MPKFESFDSGPQVDYRESSDSFESQRAVLDKLSHKFPKFKSLLTALAVATLALSVPESTKSNDIKSETSITQAEVNDQELIKVALENIDNPSFKDVARSIQAEFDAIELESPEDFLYSQVSDYSGLNDEIVINDVFEGDIPDSAQNISVGYSFSTSEVINYQDSNLDVFSRTQFVFDIRSVDEQSSLEPELKRIQLKGFGANKKEAIQNALESAVAFFGIEVESKDELASGFDGQVTTSTIQNTGRFFVKEYKLVEEDESQDETGLAPYRVVLDIVGAKIDENK